MRAHGNVIFVLIQYADLSAGFSKEDKIYGGRNMYLIYNVNMLLLPLADVDGIKHGPMIATLNKRTENKSNKWLTISLTTGKNREIRKALAQIHLTVNRIIRTHYGPYSLKGLNPGDVMEVPLKGMLKTLFGERRKQFGDDDAHEEDVQGKLRNHLVTSKRT